MGAMDDEGRELKDDVTPGVGREEVEIEKHG